MASGTSRGLCCCVGGTPSEGEQARKQDDRAVDEAGTPKNAATGEGEAAPGSAERTIKLLRGSVQSQTNKARLFNLAAIKLSKPARAKAMRSRTRW